MKKITVKGIMSWEPCGNYPEWRVKEIIGKGKTPLDICDLNIPPSDRLWVLLREEIIPEIELHLIACKFAEDALKAERKAGREPHSDSWKAIKIKRQWCEGKATDEELAAARAAAGSAARAAARAAAEAAAWSAARAAAVAAAWSAAWSAAGSAAGAAAGAAARAAAGAAAEEKQLKQIKKLLKMMEAQK